MQSIWIVYSPQKVCLRFVLFASLFRDWWPHNLSLKHKYKSQPQWPQGQKGDQIFSLELNGIPNYFIRLEDFFPGLWPWSGLFFFQSYIKRPRTFIRRLLSVVLREKFILVNLLVWQEIIFRYFCDKHPSKKIGKKCAPPSIVSTKVAIT